MPLVLANFKLEVCLVKSCSCACCPGEANLVVCEKLKKESAKHKEFLEGQLSCGNSFAWEVL